MKNISTIFFTLFSCTIINPVCKAQEKNKPAIGIMNIDSKGVGYDASTIGYIVRLEVDKTGIYNVVDKYEMADVFKKAEFNIDNCYSKSCLVNAGKLLSVDKMLSGDIEQFGEKIIINLRLIDVKAGIIEKSDASEYLNMQSDLQKMIEISVKKLFGIEPDQLLVNQLMNYDVPISSPKTTLKLNGPRMGGAFTMGESGKRLRDPKSSGGFDMYPATFQFGYQQEVQYLSAGDFQALVEFIGLVGGLESGRFIPSFALLNGFRWGKSGWEFGFGPNLRFIRKADGFFDNNGLIGNKGDWHLENDWFSGGIKDSIGFPALNPYPIVSRLDSRGSIKASTGLIIAAGRTFKSGYLNIPINIYISPRKDGWIYGFSFGFNVTQKPKSVKKS